jgi:hypothetical protein
MASFFVYPTGCKRHPFLYILLGANDLQIQALLGKFNVAVGYGNKGLLPTDGVIQRCSFGDG